MKRQVRRSARLPLLVLIGVALGLSPGDAPCQDTAQPSQAKCRTAEGKKPRRFGAVIGLKPEKKDLYIKLHAETWPSVLAQVKRSNIRNYSIYMTELQGKLYLFAYFEYTGDDFKADMEKMAKDPETQRWWKLTDPCQNRLPGTPEGQQWTLIPEVFHTD